jgi:hypothetical protein
MSELYHSEVKEFYSELGHPLRALQIMRGEPLPSNAESVYNLALEILKSEKCQNLRIKMQGSDQDEPKKLGFVYSSPPYWQETNGLIEILSKSKVDIFSFSSMFRLCRSGILQAPYTIGYLMEKANVDSNMLSKETEGSWIELESLLRNIDNYWEEIEKY